MQWDIDDGALTGMSHCHCSMCRKAHGALFATYTDAPRESFHRIAGESTITRYESSPGFTRAFCSVCGSVVPEDFKGSMSVPVGCLDDDPGVRPEAHIFADAKASWFEISGDLPRHAGYPRPGQGPNVERPSPGPAKEGVLRGSCLCGQVAYEVRTAVDNHGFVFSNGVGGRCLGEVMIQM